VRTETHEPGPSSSRNLVPALRDAGLRLDKPVVVMWEGSWGYLPVLESYRYVRELTTLHVGSMLVIDFLSSSVAQGKYGWGLKRSFEAGDRVLQAGIMLGGPDSGSSAVEGARMWCAAHGLSVRDEDDIEILGSAEKGYFGGFMAASVSGFVPPEDPFEGPFEVKAFRVGGRLALESEKWGKDGGLGALGGGPPEGRSGGGDTSRPQEL